MNHEYTTDKTLLKNPHYHKIKECIDSLALSHGARSFSGNCVATCDIMQALLSQHGISSKIMECQACIIVETSSGKSYKFVGYDNYSYPGQIDTHTVVITEGESPIIIDLSLGHLLPPDNPFVVERVKPSKSGESFSEYDFKTHSINYYEKKNLRLPNLHQKNLVQRIVSDQNIQKELSTLKIFILSAISLGVVNFALNIILIVLRLFDITL